MVATMEEPVALEIGARNLPLIQELKDLPPNSKILFADKEDSWLGSLAGGMEWIDNKTQILQGDATKLPLPSNSVELVFLKDVFGHEGSREVKSGIGFTDRLVETGGADKIARELFRVIRKGGKVIVMETNTPYDSEKLKAAFSESGFSNVKMHPKDQINKIFADPGYADAMTRFADPKSYAMEVIK